MTCTVRLLGGAILEQDGRPVGGPAAQRHRLALLALLVRAHPRPVPRERAMALLWPDRDERRARSLLNLAVHVIRGALGPRTIDVQGTNLVLHASAVTCDVLDFSSAVATNSLDRAVALYTGSFLDGLHLPAAEEFERWVEGERASLAAECARALTTLANRARSAGDEQSASLLLSRHLALDPYSSRTAVRLAESLDALGDRGAALIALERHRDRMREDLDSEPVAGVTTLMERLRGAGTPRAAIITDRRELDSDAVLYTLKARHFVGKRDSESLRKAIGYFEKARAADPQYAPAYAGLADAWSLLGFYDVLRPGEAFSHARAAAHRAVSLSPRSADGYASLGYVLLYYHWQWDRAEHAFRRAIDLDPRHALAHQWLGNCLALLGRADEAREMMRRCRALAPTSPIAHAASGWAEFFAGNHDRAIDLQMESIELEPNFPVAHLWLGQALARTRRWLEAIEALQRASVLFGRSDPAEAALARAYAEAGEPAPAREIARRLAARASAGGYAPSYELAKIHLALGDRGRAMDWLERAYAERSHSMAFLRVDPEVAKLHEESRAAALVSRVGLL